MGPISYVLTKRAVDLGFSGGAIFFFLPLFALVAVLIKLDLTGPILVRDRVHVRSRAIHVLRFRTGATEIGRFLRAERLDKLPTLINVVRGDMSLVGPSLSAFERTQSSAQEPRSSLRDFKPGIFGLAQLNHLEPFTVPDPRRCGILTRFGLFRVKNAGAGAASQIPWPACRTSRLSIFPR
jgi:lipopolysaccharide/colanic/teichoic acid biosynthesis glycosyltransferase